VGTPHRLPQLPYDYTALEPWIAESCLRFHYDYHRVRVDALNAAEAQLAAQHDSADLAWVRYMQRLVTIRASEHRMHCLFWDIMRPNAGDLPSGALADQIHDDFGSFAAFKSQFGSVATTPETGDWVALIWQPANARLALRSVYRQLPWEWEVGTLLALDVSEHAYYLQYQNRRGEYVHNWWNTVHWPRVAERFATATHLWTAAANRAIRPQRGRRNRNALSMGVDGWSQLPGRGTERGRR
jgi:superoxide dismutase, Fe-Mn family